MPLGAMSVEQKFHEGLALLSIGTLYGEDTKGVLRMERSEIWTYESGRVSFGQLSASGRFEAELAQTLMGVLTDIVSTRGAPAPCESRKKTSAFAGAPGFSVCTRHEHDLQVELPMTK